MIPANYDLNPLNSVRGHAVTGWANIAQMLCSEPFAANLRIAVELYPGADKAEIIAGLTAYLKIDRVVDVESFYRSPYELDTALAPWLGDDPVFGQLNAFEIEHLFDPEALEIARSQCDREGTILVIGTGAALVCPAADQMVYVNMARWPLQLRFREGRAFNLGTLRRPEKASLLYKRAFFVDWRAADRLKQRIMPRIDWIIDGNEESRPVLVSADDYREALKSIVKRPFRVKPYFDAGPWGGQWMRETFGLPDGPANYAWCFDCVPEENSLLFGFGDAVFEAPAIDVVLMEPMALLGDDVVSRFGAEFPIRFDLLDTVKGGNLSLQVHPRTAYIKDNFGVSYTQDESYYMLAAEPDAHVYLGLRSGINKNEMAADLRAAQAGGPAFPADTYINRFSAKAHDHFLIPGGTVHCSGAGGVVLEISATPYIFTFKLWDWGRLGLDGTPRPIHLDHGLANIAWERDTDFTNRELVNAVEPVAAGDGWREERTGLHALEFIETRRHWFETPVAHDTENTVQVMNLVSGEACLVESPSHAFEPFKVHYAETFIVPAQVGKFIIKPIGTGPHATLKAYVRREKAI